MSICYWNEIEFWKWDRTLVEPKWNITGISTGLSAESDDVFYLHMYKIVNSF